MDGTVKVYLDGSCDKVVFVIIILLLLFSQDLANFRLKWRLLRLD